MGDVIARFVGCSLVAKDVGVGFFFTKLTTYKDMVSNVESLLAVGLRWVLMCSMFLTEVTLEEWDWVRCKLVVWNLV